MAERQEPADIPPPPAPILNPPVAQVEGNNGAPEVPAATVGQVSWICFRLCVIAVVSMFGSVLISLLLVLDRGFCAIGAVN